MAVKIIGLKDNLAEVLIPNQFLPSPITLTGTYQDITPNQVLNTQGMCNLALWLSLSAASNIFIKIKCYKDLTGTLTFEEGSSIFSIKTISGVSTFTEQAYNLLITNSTNAVVQIPTSDLVSNVKIFVMGSGVLSASSITPQTRGA